MRCFNYNLIDKKIYSREIVRLMTTIHEYRGKQELYMQMYPNLLKAMVNVAKIESINASNRIEGIFTSDKRFREILLEKAEPSNRAEEEIKGYQDVLNTIHEKYSGLLIQANTILEMHRDLYTYSSVATGGNYKTSDNFIQEVDIFGKKNLRFAPVSAYQTPYTMECLCDEFTSAIQKNEVDPLLLIPIFLLDFLCIHPYSDGNGRISRLLTHMLLFQENYIVGKYISIDMIIEKTKDVYYDTLLKSSFSWHENDNDYGPFVRYYLSIVASAYKELFYRLDTIGCQKLNKTERVKHIFKTKVGIISKSDIASFYPDISLITIEKALSSLLAEGYIRKVKGGRSTAYVVTDKP